MLLPQLIRALAAINLVVNNSYQGDQIRHADIHPCLHQERRDLPSMVRLVVEEMGQCLPRRMRPLNALGIAVSQGAQ